MKSLTIIFLLILAVTQPNLATASGISVVQADENTEFTDPWKYCEAIRDMDYPDTGPVMSEIFLKRIIDTFNTSADIPVEGIKWRCVKETVWVCLIGANLPCSVQADIKRTPTPAMNQYCQENPGAEFIPAYVTGRETVYNWSCQDTVPQVKGQWSYPDSRGFHNAIWLRIDPVANLEKSE